MRLATARMVGLHFADCGRQAFGMWAGQIPRRAVSPAAFRRWFLIMLALLGGEMLLRGMAQDRMAQKIVPQAQSEGRDRRAA